MKVQLNLLAFLSNQRFWLSGPAALVASLLVMLAMSAWFPPGIGRVNNIIVPLVMFPLIWAVLFFYTYLTPRMHYAWWLLAVLIVLDGAILAYQFWG